MDNMLISGTELAIQSVEDGLSPIINGSAISSSSSSSLFLRKIEFHPARKPFSGFGNRGDYRSGDFRIETLNSDYGSHKRPLGLNPCQPGKKVDGSDLVENGLDFELSFGVACRRIGAGLHNLGNTCFLNSVLQCLTYTEPLAAYLQSGKHKKNTCHVAGFCALCAIQKHVSQALQSTGRSLVPKDLVSNLRCVSRNFRNARQEDAHEYMVNLLESMHKCCLPSGVPSESPAAYEKSLVHKIFGGRLRSQVQCQQCMFCSNKFDPFLDLSLEIYKADTLPVALRNFTAAELLDGGEKQYQCQQCKQKVRAKKRLTIHKAPYVLTIHLKRFHALDPGRKVDKKVTFDRSLDMKPFISDTYEGDLKYSLYGVLVHYGHNTHSGHYVCFVRTSSGIWYLLNDNEVREVSEKRVLEQKAYMLFYVRDRKTVAPRKTVDVICKENMRANVNIADLVFKHLSKESAIYEGSAGNKSLSAVDKNDSVDVFKDKKGALNTSTSEKIFHRETSNHFAISESVAKATSGVESSSKVLQKDPAKEISAGSKPNPGAEPPSSSYTAKVGNANVQAVANLIDSAEPECPPTVKLETNAASEKMDPLRNGRVDGTSENPIVSRSVDSVGRMPNEIDNVKSEDKICCESRKDVNSPVVKSGVRGERNVSELVLRTVMQNERAPNCLPPKKSKKKHLRRRNNTLQFGRNFFRASLGSRKKKKPKKSKRYNLETLNLIKEHHLESYSLSSEVEQSACMKSVPVAANLQGEGKSCLKNGGDSLIGTVEEGLKNRNNHNCNVVDVNKHFNNSSFSSSEKKRQDANDFGETVQKRKSENEIMCVLTRGIETTTVARWDGLESSSSQMMESSSSRGVGYVLDEWDEEYDRGKRKKLRSNKHEFGGPNPFQEIASVKKQIKKPKMDRSSSGNKPFRI